MINRFFNNFKDIFWEVSLVVLITIAFLCLLFHNLFFNPFYYFAADISEVYFPLWVFLNNSIHSFQLPILNQFWFLGSLPFLPIEGGLFYPLYIVPQLFFKAQNNLNVSYLFFFGIEILHYLIASINFYLFARLGLRLDRFPSIFGAIIFSCSGVFIGRFVHPVTIYAISWFPAVFLFYMLFVQKKKIIYAIGTIVSLILIVVSSHPQIVYYSYIFFGLGIVYFSIFNRWQKKWLLFFLSMLIIIFSLFLGSFRILPALELSQNIVRTTYETSIKNLYNSIHPLYYLTLVVPYLFGRHQVGYWGSDYPWGNWENYIYIGMLPILFLFFSLFWKDKRMLCFFLVGLFFSLFLLLGKFNPLSAFVDKSLPFSENTTMVSKLTTFFHFFLVVLSTIGLQVFTSDNKTKKKILVLLFAIASVGVVLFWLNPKLIPLLQPAGRPPPSPESIMYSIKNLMLARYIWIVASLSLLGFVFFGKKDGMWTSLIFLFFAVDIFLNGGNFNPIESSPGTPMEYFGSNKMIEKIKEDKEIFRVDNLWPRNINMIQQVESTYGYHTIETEAYDKASSFINFRNRNILNLWNIKYFISEENLATKGDFSLVSPGLWKNDKVMERFTFVASCRLVESKDEIIQVLGDPEFDPRKEVVLYKFSKTVDDNLCSDGNQPLTVTSKIDIIKYNSGFIEIEIFAERQGFIIFSQPQYPGWFAKVDGAKKDLIPADLSIYALPVEQGTHKVQFIYKSSSLINGLLISLASMCVSVLLFLFLRKRENKLLV